MNNKEIKEFKENPISWAIKERDKYWRKKFIELIDEIDFRVYHLDDWNILKKDIKQKIIGK